MNTYWKCLFGLVLLIVGHRLAAQEIDTNFAKRPMDYRTYIGLVGQENAAYAAEKFNVDMAEAEMETARVFPDPELHVGWFDNGERRKKMGYGFESELSWTLELGGKRKARMNLAADQAKLTSFLLEDYFRNLRADATIAFLLAMQKRMLLDVQYRSYLQVNKLAVSDSLRHSLGEISQVDARQSKLEAGALLQEVYAAEAEWKTSLAALSLLIGQEQSDTLVSPQGNFSAFERDFSLQELVTASLNNRADVQAALQNKDVSQRIWKLAKANRAMDLGISLGVDYNAYAHNDIAPTPTFTTIRAGVTIPLKFSNSKKGELRSAQYGRLQAEQTYRQAELEIQAEVTQAYHGYLAAQKQVRQYNTGLLAESKAILAGKVYSYRRGETSLLEVLDAQRTYNEVQQGYHQTLFNYAMALVELERAAGIWDINF